MFVFFSSKDHHEVFQDQHQNLLFVNRQMMNTLLQFHLVYKIHLYQYHILLINDQFLHQLLLMMLVNNNEQILRNHHNHHYLYQVLRLIDQLDLFQLLKTKKMLEIFFYQFNIPVIFKYSSRDTFPSLSSSYSLIILLISIFRKSLSSSGRRNFRNSS